MRKRKGQHMCVCVCVCVCERCQIIWNYRIGDSTFIPNSSKCIHSMLNPSYKLLLGNRIYKCWQKNTAQIAKGKCILIVTRTGHNDLGQNTTFIVDYH